jgi:hypothetical protein
MSMIVERQVPDRLPAISDTDLRRPNVPSWPGAVLARNQIPDTQIF